MCLVGVGKTTHTRHHAEHVVVGSVNANLGSVGSGNGGIGKHQLKGGVINTGEVAGSRGLVLLRAKGEGVDVDTGIGGTGVSLEGLHNVEVRSLTLGETILAVELKLGNDDRVLSPAVHVQGGLGKHEGSSVRHSRVGGTLHRGVVNLDVLSVQGKSGGVSSVGVGESVVLDESITILSSRKSLDSPLRAEGMKSVGEGINGIGEVKGLSTEELEEGGVADEGRAVVDVSVGLHNPDELLHGVVEVQLDLVGRRTDGLVTSELKLGDEILVGVLGEAATLVGVQEHVVDVEGSSNEGLVVGNGGSLGHLGTTTAVKLGDSPQALVNGAEIKVDLDLVVLKSDQGKGKTGVGAVPELKGNIEGSLGKGIARSAHLTGSVGITRSIDICEGRVGDEGKTSGVTDHLEVSRLLGRAHGELVPDVHPVTVLTVDALATNLNLNLGDKLLTGEIQPAGIHLLDSLGSHGLVNLRHGHLKVGAIGKITIAADSAGHTATEIGLSVESLLNRLNGEVGISAVGHLPESDLRISSQIDILSAVGYELHKSASHDYTISKEKKIFSLR